MLTVPYSACIGTTGLRCGAGRGAPPPFSGATPAECLAWTLLGLRDESEQSGAADWAPYLGALPAAVDSPTSGRWGRKQVAELQLGHAVFVTAKSLAKDAKGTRALGGGGGQGGCGGESGGGGGGGGPERGGDGADGGVSAVDWAWALSCVRSRAIEVESGFAVESLLVPFLDMFNHVHAEPHAAWASDSVSLGAIEVEGEGDGGVVVLTALRDIPAGRAACRLPPHTSWHLTTTPVITSPHITNLTF